MNSIKAKGGVVNKNEVDTFYGYYFYTTLLCRPKLRGAHLKAATGK